MLAVAFGSEVNLLKGEGSLLTEAAAGFFGSLSDSFFTLENMFSCEYLIVTYTCISKFLSVKNFVKFVRDFV